MATIEEADYCFVVADSARNSILLQFRSHDEAAKQQYLGVWHKLSQAIQKHHQLAGGPPAPEWAAWKPGEWCDQQRGYENRQKVVAWCGNHLVGFLNLWPDVEASHQHGKRVLYIEHLAAAPGNLTTELWDRRYAGVGAALFAYAVLFSHQRGHEGRLGLHVADEAALRFYRHLNDRCGGALFYPERTGVPGPTPRGPHEAGKTYLETTEAGAMRWLEEYRRA
jgi:GNAT superfamily N-acetyltransferase